MATWNALRMHRDGLAHCGQLYETIIDGIGIYRELREHNGCEATRRLRSVRADGKNAVGIRCDWETPSKANAKEATKTLGFNWHQNNANKNQSVKSYGTMEESSTFAYGPNGAADTVILGNGLLSTNACQPAYSMLPMDGSANLSLITINGQPPAASAASLLPPICPTNYLFHPLLLPLSLVTNLAFLFCLIAMLIRWRIGHYDGMIRQKSSRTMRREQFEEIQ
ncbi:hypothetical protein niasHT_033310 [Heterodera trifolii]|uniref:Uncharacterized protein n=1 Tax=Heterodera trifolii TaxID=157864 RepID=A0ABD2I814_9BILA